MLMTKLFKYASNSNIPKYQKSNDNFSSIHNKLDQDLKRILD